jgi:hypothetical protein
MDVVAVGDVGERFEQLFETFAAAEDSAAGDTAGAASWRVRGRPYLVDLIHPSAFFRAIPAATQTRPVAG